MSIDDGSDHGNCDFYGAIETAWEGSGNHGTTWNSSRRRINHQALRFATEHCNRTRSKSPGILR